MMDQDHVLGLVAVLCVAWLILVGLVMLYADAHQTKDERWNDLLERGDPAQGAEKDDTGPI